MPCLLIELIHEVASEPLLIDPKNRAAEVETNTRWFSITEHDIHLVEVPPIVEALHDLAKQRQHLLVDSGSAVPMSFYVWFDDQACQLRLSTESAPADGLSFRGPYRPDAQLEDVVAAFLDSPCHDGIRDLVSESGELEDASADPSPLSVYVNRLKPCIEAAV